MLEPRSEQPHHPIVVPLDQGDDRIEVSIVMPCLNEADTLETCIRKAQRALSENSIAGEVVIVTTEARMDHRRLRLASACASCMPAVRAMAMR